MSWNLCATLATTCDRDLEFCTAYGPYLLSCLIAPATYWWPEQVGHHSGCEPSWGVGQAALTQGWGMAGVAEALGVSQVLQHHLQHGSHQ